MTPHQFQRVKELLQEAWDRDCGQRAAFLDEACADDPALRLHVDALLAAEENMGDFLAQPAADLANARSTTGASDPGRTTLTETPCSQVHALAVSPSTA